MRRAGLDGALRCAGTVGLVSLLHAGVALGAVTVRSEVDAPKVGLADTVQLTITVEGAGGGDEMPRPPLTNLQIVAGPMQSTQVSIVNGRLSQSRSFTYVLQPTAAGKAEVGRITVGDQTAPAIAIEVVPGSIRPRDSDRRPDPFGIDPFGGDPFGDPFGDVFGRRRARAPEGKLFLEAVPSRSRLRVGESLVLTYSLVTQVAVAGLQPKEAPQYAGFWTEDLERPQVTGSGEPVTIEGESYRRFPLIRKLLFPTKAGKLTLPSASFRVTLARQSFFDTGGIVERATRPVTVTVEPLPDAPGFAGAVGRLSASASLDRDVVPFGEAATLRFRVEGTGNLKWLDKAPEVAASGAKVYPPQAKSDLKTTAEGITGSRTWEFVVVPQTSGVVEIPALPFSWFDPGAGRIVTTQTKPLSLRVEGGTAAAAEAHALASTPTSRGFGALPLRSDLDAASAHLTLSGRVLLLLLGLAVAAHGGLWGAVHLSGRTRRGGARIVSSRSVRSVLRDLDRAGQDGLSKEQAATLVEKALHEAFGEIGDGDDGTERSRAIRALLDEVHFVRYAPQLGDYSDRIRALAARGAEVVRRWA